MAKREKQFPKEIFVGVEHSQGEPYMVAEKSPDTLIVQNSDRVIAIYQFVRMAKVMNKTEVR